MHVMDDQKWFDFFHACAETLKVEPAHPHGPPVEGGSWCSWTTFDRLEDSAGYWSGPLPTIAEIKETYLGHGANWSQYFHYRQLCHVIVPRKFAWERATPDQFEIGDVFQEINVIAEKLKALHVPHRLVSIALEIKCY